MDDGDQDTKRSEEASNIECQWYSGKSMDVIKHKEKSRNGTEESRYRRRGQEIRP
jgi:hypothetical protein